MIRPTTELVDRLLSPEDVADVLGISRRTVYRLIKEDQVLPAARIRGSIRVRISDLNQYVAGQTA
jgi:excisionase family DNA binding protein